MAKKDKNEVPNPSAVANRDIIHRLNFLYQASVYLNGMDNDSRRSEPTASASSPVRTTTGDEEKGMKKSKRRKHRKIGVKELAKSYINTMKIVGTKTTVRMDPSVKRTLCKGCNVVLAPGSTASVRVKGEFASHLFSRADPEHIPQPLLRMVIP
ncbi:hypothetical protein V5O48_013762 [Marasmius crinis-equi]|uniref:Uncharacterized protein n=1 Tax=Marasmius crinis-equi TaxID=585013 RepID=A0ABR3EZK2_9AGAR